MHPPIVLVLDQRHAQELAITMPTWLRWHPELRQFPFHVLFYDRATETYARPLFDGLQVTWHPWDREGVEHLPHRELALFQYLCVVPQLVASTGAASWVKIDTDVVAWPHYTSEAWIDDWQATDVVTGSPWGRTKPAGAVAEWCRVFDRSAPPHRTLGNQDKCPRLIGWLSQHDTAFTAALAQTARETISARAARAPVSHDTLTWLLAPEGRWRSVPYSLYGWSHGGKLELAAESSLRATGLLPLTHGDSVATLVDQIGAARVAEVGVYRGELARYVLARCPGIECYTMVDWWRPAANGSDYHASGDQRARATPANHVQAYQLALTLTDRWGLKRQVVCGASAEVEVPGPFDLVFIDAAHDEASVRADLAHWAPLVRPGGILAGHDYGHRRYHGVKAAWDAFAGSRPLEVLPGGVVALAM